MGGGGEEPAGEGGTLGLNEKIPVIGGGKKGVRTGGRRILQGFIYLPPRSWNGRIHGGGPFHSGEGFLRKPFLFISGAKGHAWSQQKILR